MNRPGTGHLPSACGAALLLALMRVAGVAAPEDARIAWGRDQLSQALHDAGYVRGAVTIATTVDPQSPLLPASARHAEGFGLKSSVNRIDIAGDDPAGVLYGCLAAADRIRREGELLADWTSAEAPRMEWRGPCVLLMKLGDYNFPVTPQEFPFFYDRACWLDWLDFMAAQRFNCLALWNGHPFAYFTRFDRYPEAQAGMAPDLIERNRELLHWLVVEAGRRNIRLLFEFYNIHTSVYFQRAHNLPAENRAPTPLLRDYTAYAVETFAREFPEVGYYITPGEAIEPEYTDGWVNDVLIPAMHRGGTRGPIWLRSWGIDLPRAQRVAAAHPEVWMERKYNVEMIAGTRQDPANRAWAALDGRFVVNIHMAGNLEPFRWCPPDYIRQCVLSAVGGGATGLHLYPRKSWRWPEGAEPVLPLEQWERDRFWFEAWARYAWDPDRDPAADQAWWRAEFTRYLGDAGAAADLLSAQATAADVLPGLQRLFWLGDSNHTVVAAGARLSEIEHAPGIPFLPVPDVAQRMPEFLAALGAGHSPPHPTPVGFLDTLVDAAARAAELTRQAAQHAIRHRAEAAAWARDAEAVQLVARFYRQKTEAAVVRARAAASGGGVKGDAFLQPLAQSLDTYRSLAALLTPAYDSISDVPAWNPARLKKVPYHWNDIIPLFEREVALLRQTFDPSVPPASTAPDLPGLAGLLYGDPGLRRVKAADPITALALHWPDDDPERGRGWSAEWHGFLIWPREGRVTLRVHSDQSVRLEVRGETLLDGTGFPGTREVSISAGKGETVSLTLTYDHPSGSHSFLDIQWDGSGSGFSTVPATALRHSEKDARWASSAVVMSEL